MSETTKIFSDSLLVAIREIVREEISALNESQSITWNEKTKPKPANAPLDESEVASRLGVSRSTARRLILNGAIPSITIASGRRKKLIRVRPEVLERWIQSRENGSPRRRRKYEQVET